MTNFEQFSKLMEYALYTAALLVVIDVIIFSISEKIKPN